MAGFRAPLSPIRSTEKYTVGPPRSNGGGGGKKSSLCRRSPSLSSEREMEASYPRKRGHLRSNLLSFLILPKKEGRRPEMLFMNPRKGRGRGRKGRLRSFNCGGRPPPKKRKEDRILRLPLRGRRRKGGGRTDGLSPARAIYYLLVKRRREKKALSLRRKEKRDGTGSLLLVRRTLIWLLLPRRGEKKMVTSSRHQPLSRRKGEEALLQLLTGFAPSFRKGRSATPTEEEKEKTPAQRPGGKRGNTNFREKEGKKKRSLRSLH